MHTVPTFQTRTIRLFQRLIRYFTNTAKPIAKATPIRIAIAILSSTLEIGTMMRAIANHFSDTRHWRLANPAIDQGEGGTTRRRGLKRAVHKPQLFLGNTYPRDAPRGASPNIPSQSNPQMSIGICRNWHRPSVDSGSSLSATDKS